MQKLKKTLVIFTSVGLFSMQAHANDAQTKYLEAQPVIDLNRTDMNEIFEQTSQTMQAVTLSKHEMKETEGALMNFVIAAGVGAAGGVGFYVGSALINDRPMTLQGALYSAGTGALVGVGGSALIGAAGGGLVANIAWRPSIMAANYGLGQYRRYREW